MLSGIMNLCFDVALSVPVVIMIEPSKDVWGKAHGKIYELLEILFGRIKGINFLGSRTSYSVPIPREFKDSGPMWFDKNRDRVSLIGHILEELEKERFRGMIVVFCSALPVDVEDWHESDLLERILFVRTAGESFGYRYHEIGIEAPPTSIMNAIDNPVKRVFIKGKGFVPLLCEITPKGKVDLIYKDGEFELVLPFLEGGFKCHLKCLCKESAPLLYVKREKGLCEPIEGKDEHPWFDEPKWEKIPERLRPVIEAGILKSEFICPQCKRAHRYDTFICPEGDIILKGMPLNTCILFRKWNYLMLSGFYAYPLKEGKRVITSEGKIYDWKGGVWEYMSEIRPYSEVDNDVWGLFIRI